MRYTSPKQKRNLQRHRSSTSATRRMKIIQSTCSTRRMSALEDPVGAVGRMGRLVFIGSCLSLFAIGIVTRLYTLQSGQHRRWLELASKQHFASFEIQGARGDIVDAAGRPLAVSVSSVALGAHPRSVSNKQEVAEKLSSRHELSKEELSEKLSQDKSFVWLAKGLPVSAEKTVELLNSNAINSYREFRRYYPQGSLAGPLLGRVDRDGAGQSGIERQFDDLLAASNYKVSVHRDARGRYVRALQDGKALKLNDLFPFVDEAHASQDMVRKEGAGLQLTIDSVIQGIVEQEFQRGLKDAKAKKVFGLILDAETGGIVASSQTNGFNPNQFSNVSSEDLRNVVVQDAFEPGSTFKPIVAALALDKKLVSASEVMDCENGRYQVGKYTIRDVHPIAKVNLERVLVESSNICMTKLGQRLGKQALHEGLLNFGFGEKTGVELPGEAKGILRHANVWANIDVATHSFGQGIAVTSLQLVRAYAALVNGGKLIQPTLLHSQIQKLSEQPQVVSASAGRQVIEMLRGVTDSEGGTGRRAAISGISVYGKTGTAQKPKQSGRGYDPDRVLSSFIGVVDGNQIGLDRKLVMLVVVDEPGVFPRWGGSVAGPVFKRSMSRTLSYLLAQTKKETI